MRLLSLSIIFLLLNFSFSAFAEPRPKIGLVLSGGGAKGAAHIGVLKVLEENRVPVDYVVGTSIGAYVGGLYALGYSASQIEEIMLKLPWDKGYSDFIPRQLLSFENKKLRDQYNLTFRIGYGDGKIKVPSGLLLGQSADQLLKMSTDVVPIFDSFDELAIPYRAIASDIATAKAFTITKGSITKAMRASAAVPGVVEPVNIDGKLLVDGGIANNMPVDVVKAMGADIVIAVDIGSPLLEKEEISSTIDVINQLSNILTNSTTLLQKTYLSEQDILLRPEINNLSTTDFSIMPQALEFGKKVALQSEEKIAKLALNRIDYQNHLQHKKEISHAWFNRFNKSIIDIEYRNNSKVSQVIIENKLAIKVGDIVTKQALDAAIIRVYSLDEFEHVHAEFIDLPQGRRLILTTNKKSWGPNYLQFGFSLQSDFTLRSIIALDAAYIQHDFTPNGGQWRNSARVGWEALLASELYQPLDKKQHFFGKARVAYEQDKWAQTITRPELTGESLKGDIGFGYNFTANGALELGVSLESGELAFQDKQLGALDYRAIGGYAAFNFDNLDSINFPTKGNKLSLNVFLRHDNYDGFDGIEPDDKSLEVQLDWRGAFSIGHHAFVGIASFATVQNDTDFSVHISELGGFLNLSGYSQDELIGTHKAFAAVVYQYDLGRELFGESSLPLYLGASVETGNVWTIQESVTIDDMINSGSLYLGTDTSFGPAVFGFGFASGGKSTVFISLGKSF